MPGRGDGHASGAVEGEANPIAPLADSNLRPPPRVPGEIGDGFIHLIRCRGDVPLVMGPNPHAANETAPVGTMPGMAVEWVEDPSAFSTRDWTELVRRDPDGTFFHTPGFMKIYWEEFGAGTLLFGFVVERGETVAVAAFEIADGVLAFLGGFDVTDYMGPVGVPGTADRAAKELLSGLTDRDDWERGELRGLPEDGTWFPAILEGARDAGLEPDPGLDGMAPFFALPESYEEYLGSLRAKDRHELRRKERRLLAEFPSARLVDSTPETLGADLDRFVELHRSSAGEKGRFMRHGMELFFRRLADEHLETGTFRLAFLEAEGEKIAGVVGFRDGPTFRLYNSAYDHARAELSPGIVLVARLIQDAVESGLAGFDLLKADLPYKYRFGAEARRVRSIGLPR